MNEFGPSQEKEATCVVRGARERAISYIRGKITSD